jgi:ADP-heptose:LPS heptosyltransferase
LVCDAGLTAVEAAASLAVEGTNMDEREKDRAARNRGLIARMGGPPTKAQILAELDLEITDTLNLAAATNFPTLVRLLRMAKLEVGQIQRRADFKDKT